MRISRSKTIVLASLATASLVASAQKHKNPVTENVGPATLSDQAVILWEPEVVQHWPRTLDTINAPASLITLSPGQCLRVGALSRGKGHEHFLDGLTIGFSVSSAGATTDQPLVAPSATKHIKPEGMDFITAALGAGKVDADLSSMNSTLAASAGHWCAPADAAPGPVEIHATVELKGKQTALKPIILQLIVPETPPPFTAEQEKDVYAWLTTYHQHPEPALLGKAIDKVMLSGKMSGILQEGFIAALKQDPATAVRLGPWLTHAGPSTQIAVSVFLQSAGLKLDKPVTLTAEQKAVLAKFPVPDDPAQFSPDQTQFEKLDRLWCRYTMTGDYQPVATLVAMLAWHKDYPALEELQEAHARGEDSSKTGLTPELVRGVAYTAVGWSLLSFQRSDGLAADYIASIAADPATPKDIKHEIAGMGKNPVFNRSSSTPSKPQ